jgi:hypothetical protein
MPQCDMAASRYVCVCVYVTYFLHVFMHACMYACMHTWYVMHEIDPFRICRSAIWPFSGGYVCPYVVRVCMCVYVCACMYVSCVPICIYIYTYIHTYIYKYMDMHTHTFIHTYIHTHNQKNGHIPVHVCIYIHTFMHPCTPMHTYTHTHTQVGDEVLEIEGIEINSIHQIKDLTVGPVGTKCMITVKRGNSDEYEVELERRADASSPARCVFRVWILICM